LTKERVTAGLAAARRRGRVGGRPPTITDDKLESILAALSDGMSKAAACRNLGVKRTPLMKQSRESAVLGQHEEPGHLKSGVTHGAPLDTFRNRAVQLTGIPGKPG
jgi:DNA invertase Pin-like site-specific DNA recombinase